MGCFSFICKECGKPILSNSYRGQKVKLFLLKNGGALEEMEGEYDSYGCVFDKQSNNSIEWNTSWDKVCDLMNSDYNKNGIAAIHSKCFVDIPSEKSDDDPDQGWGDDCWLLDNYDENIEFD